MRDFQFLGHREQPGAVLVTSAQYGVEKARVFSPLITLVLVAWRERILAMVVTDSNERVWYLVVGQLVMLLEPVAERNEIILHRSRGSA